MEITIDTDNIHLPENLEVLEAALDQIDNGSIVTVDTWDDMYSFVATNEDSFICSDGEVGALDRADLVDFIQGGNPDRKDAIDVEFSRATLTSLVKDQNSVLGRVLSALPGEMFLDGWFVACGSGLFLDMRDGMKPVSNLTVANTLWLKEHADKPFDFSELLNNDKEDKG